MSPRKLITTGAVLGVVALGLVMSPRLTPPDARACGPSYYTTRDPRPNITKIKGRWEVKLTYLHRYYSFRGGNYQLNRLHVFSKDKKFAKWLHSNGAKAATWKAVRLSASRFTCLDLLQGKRLVKLERTLARGIAKHYRKQTKRSAPKVDVMLSLATYYNRTCQDPKKKRTTP
jgi:hypothetical protein